jgi:pentatricopeptide repeat protein
MQQTKNPTTITGLIEKMKKYKIQRDAIAYTLLISAYCERGHMEKAMEILRSMEV